MNSEEQEIHRYCGLITQDDFRQRYAFIKARTNLNFTRDELSFLIGKPPYFIADYEEMNSGIKLALEDLAILSLFLINLYPEILPFDVDDFGCKEKRVVRGKCEEISGFHQHIVTHPWTINYINTPVKLTEKLAEVDIEEEQKIEMLRKHILELMANGHFTKRMSSLAIYREAEKFDSLGFCLKPRYVMKVVYDLVTVRKLKMVTERSTIFYQGYEKP
jgi:hypothetical protein